MLEVQVICGSVSKVHMQPLDNLPRVLLYLGITTVLPMFALQPLYVCFGYLNRYHFDIVGIQWLQHHDVLPTSRRQKVQGSGCDDIASRSQRTEVRESLHYEKTTEVDDVNLEFCKHYSLVLIRLRVCIKAFVGSCKTQIQLYSLNYIDN